MRTTLARFLFGAFGLWILLHGASSRAADITATEARWLQGARPVLLYAREAGLPLDIVVQPQPTPDLPPMALAFIDGRCKLVLSAVDEAEVRPPGDGQRRKWGSRGRGAGAAKSV